MSATMRYALSMQDKIDSIVGEKGERFQEKVDALTREIQLIDKSVRDVTKSNDTAPLISLRQRTAAGRLSALQQGIAQVGRFDDIQRASVSKKDFESLSPYFKETEMYIPESGGRRSFRGPSGMHAHEHDDRVVLHTDKNDPTKTTLGMFSHMATEGLPAGLSQFSKKIGPSGMSAKDKAALSGEIDLGRFK